MISYHFGLITLFAVHNFRTLGSERSFDLFLASITSPGKKFHWSPFPDTVCMTAVKAFPRNGNSLPAVELQFCRDYSVIPLT